MSQRYSPYWVMSGLSNPSWCLTWVITAGGTWPPSDAETGSPGATRISRKTSVSRISTIGTMSARRVSAYRLSEVPVPVTTVGRGAAAAPLPGWFDLRLRDHPEPHDV